jgi:hypothetical protein
MVDYHKKYLKYKQKHLMSKMNTFTGGAQVTTISSIEEVVTKAAPGKKIIDPNGILTTLTQMRFKETQNDNCNNIATLIKQVPCLSVKIEGVDFKLESTDDVVTFSEGAEPIVFTIGGKNHTAEINKGKITKIELEDKSGTAAPVPAGVNEYIIELTGKHLPIKGDYMHNGNNLKKCTITFKIDTNKPTDPSIVTIAMD